MRDLLNEMNSMCFVAIAGGKNRYSSLGCSQMKLYAAGMPYLAECRHSAGFRPNHRYSSPE